MGRIGAQIKESSDGSKIGFKPNFCLMNPNEPVFLVKLGEALRLKNWIKKGQGHKF